MIETNVVFIVSVALALLFFIIIIAAIIFRLVIRRVRCNIHSSSSTPTTMKSCGSSSSQMQVTPTNAIPYAKPSHTVFDTAESAKQTGILRRDLERGLVDLMTTRDTPLSAIPTNNSNKQPDQLTNLTTQTKAVGYGSDGTQNMKVFTVGRTSDDMPYTWRHVLAGPNDDYYDTAGLIQKYGEQPMVTVFRQNSVLDLPSQNSGLADKLKRLSTENFDKLEMDTQKSFERIETQLRDAVVPVVVAEDLTPQSANSPRIGYDTTVKVNQNANNAELNKQNDGKTLHTSANPPIAPVASVASEELNGSTQSSVTTKDITTNSTELVEAFPESEKLDNCSVEEPEAIIDKSTIHSSSNLTPADREADTTSVPLTDQLAYCRQ